MPREVLNCFRVNPSIEQIGNVGMPQLMRCHIKIYRVLYVGIILLLHAQRRLHAIFDALSVYIFIVGSLFGRTNYYILPDTWESEYLSWLPWSLTPWKLLVCYALSAMHAARKYKVWLHPETHSPIAGQVSLPGEGQHTAQS